MDALAAGGSGKIGRLFRLGVMVNIGTGRCTGRCSYAAIPPAIFDLGRANWNKAMTNTEIDKKILNPAASYSRPEDVVQDAKLSREEKIKILREWHYDAIRLQESDGENMTGGEPDRLRSISNALLKLGVSPAAENDPKAAPKSSALRKAHRYLTNAVDALRLGGQRK